MNCIKSIFKIRSIQKFVFVGIPLSWFLVFLLIPIMFIFIISLTSVKNAIPPFNNVLNYHHGTLKIVLNFKNYIEIAHDKIIYIAIYNSVFTSIITTILCILFGYPIALALSRMRKYRIFFLTMIIIPYWTSFLLRTYAWITILDNSKINKFLMYLGFSSMSLLYNSFSMYLGMVYCYLPFLIIPLYNSLAKIDDTLYQAASDLGARPVTIFFKITLPLSQSGLMIGSLLVFIPTLGEIIVPQIMGGLNNIMIGNIIWEQFFNVNNWGISASISVTLLMILLISIFFVKKLENMNA